MSANQEEIRTVEKPRMLNSVMPNSTENYIQDENGGLLVKGVVLLATGEWTDSKAKTPLFYPPETLKKYAENWVANTYWARHLGGSPRNIVTDRLGEVRNVHYEPDVEGGAIVGDLYYDGFTLTSRDGAMLALAKAKAGHPMAVSAEHGGTETWDSINNRYVASSLAFYGLASVDKGACSVCNLPKKLNESHDNGVRELEQAEFEKALADFKAEILGMVDAKLAALKIPDESESKAELSATKDELMKELSEAKVRIDNLEKLPNHKTVAGVPKELELADAVKMPRIVGNSIICE